MSGLIACHCTTNIPFGTETNQVLFKFFVLQLYCCCFLCALFALFGPGTSGKAVDEPVEGEENQDGYGEEKACEED